MEDIPEESDDGAEIVGKLLQHRNKEDLIWEYEHLSFMLDTLSDLSGRSSKMTALLGILDKRRLSGPGRIRQTVIFTRFYDTLTDIVERLRRIDPNMRISTFSGQGGQISDFQNFKDSGYPELISTDREEVRRGFLNKETDILVCTDAAAEGLNLQTADLLINFDLPWNPMKVEQRIGRIDRIGQTHEKVYVCNLCYAGSAEEIVYGRLLSRLARAGDIVGIQQMSLLPVTRDDFKNLAEGKLSEAELEKKARKEANLVQKQSARREISPEELYHIYLRLRRKSTEDRNTSPLTPDTIWKVLSGSSYLRDIGCTVFSDKSKKAISLRNIPGISDGTILTTSRRTFEYGLKGINGKLHFGSYGDPVFDAVLNYMSESHMPGCIRRLETEVSECNGRMAAYAVACSDSDGHAKTKLVTAYDDLEGLKINESAILTKADIGPLQKKLKALAQAEFRHIRISGHIESLNKKAAISQTVLHYMIIRSLMQLRQKFGTGEEFFQAEVRSIEERYKNEDFQQIADLEKEKVQKLQGVLFDIQIPYSGNKAIIKAPVFLIMTALDTVCQLANRMRRKKSDLLTIEVLSRINREMNKLLSILS